MAAQVTAMDGPFNQQALMAQQSAFAMLESIDDTAQKSMNEAQAGWNCR